MLTLSAILAPLSCETNSKPCENELQVILFLFSLYIIAVTLGGHKPCVQAFGADQFDEQDLEECKSKSSFFNWWYFSVSAGAVVTPLILSYIQENLSWVLGFGIPCIAMLIGLVVFLLGTTTYRYSITRNKKSPFVRIGRVFVAAFRNWRRATPSSTTATDHEENMPRQTSSKQFK